MPEAEETLIYGGRRTGKAPAPDFLSKVPEIWTPRAVEGREDTRNTQTKRAFAILKSRRGSRHAESRPMARRWTTNSTASHSFTLSNDPARCSRSRSATVLAVPSLSRKTAFSTTSPSLGTPICDLLTPKSWSTSRGHGLALQCWAELLRNCAEVSTLHPGPGKSPKAGTAKSGEGRKGWTPADRKSPGGATLFSYPSPRNEATTLS